jgi:YidC/Oxa1 family membrane protein insertase
MDNQKLFLIIAISLSLFLLWDKWTFKDTPNTVVNSVEQADTITMIEADLNSDIPNYTAQDLSLDVRGMRLMSSTHSQLLQLTY